LFIVGGIIFFHLDTKRKNEIDKVGLEDLNLQLIGVIESVDKGNNYHGYGIIRLKIISSNIQEYDPRGKQEFYFCIIKNGVAEIYDHTSVIFKKDTLVYDTKAKMGGYLRNGKKEDYGSISIYGNKDYYEYIKQHTIFK
jgi:hypothetical protein